ncbi:hypothetical protein ACVXZ4_11675 [Lacisediminihabitans sp. FW035]
MRRAAVLVAGILAVALGLTGCAGTAAPATTPTASAYSREVASRLQSAVLSVTSSAEADPTAALARLDELATMLADARARGEVSAARFDSIAAAIALVRTDLEAAIAAQDASKPGKTEKPGKPGNGNHGKNR